MRDSRGKRKDTFIMGRDKDKGDKRKDCMR